MSYPQRLDPVTLREIEMSMHRIRQDSRRLTPLLFPRMLDPSCEGGRPVIPSRTSEGERT